MATDTARLAGDAQRLQRQQTDLERELAAARAARPTAAWIRRNTFAVCGITGEDRIAGLRAMMTGDHPPEGFSKVYTSLLPMLRDQKQSIIHLLTPENLGRWVLKGDVINCLADSQQHNVRAAEILALVVADVLDGEGRGGLAVRDLSRIVGEVEDWQKHQKHIEQLEFELASVKEARSRAVEALAARLKEDSALLQELRT